MVSKYPHTAVFSWASAGTYNTIGVWTPGTVHTIGVVCDAQPNSSRFITGAGGAVLNYEWQVFTPLFTGVSSIPKDAKLTFFNADHIIVQLFAYQKHVEIKCQD